MKKFVVLAMSILFLSGCFSNEVKHFSVYGGVETWTYSDLDDPWYISGNETWFFEDLSLEIAYRTLETDPNPDIYVSNDTDIMFTFPAEMQMKSSAEEADFQIYVTTEENPFIFDLPNDYTVELYRFGTLVQRYIYKLEIDRRNVTETSYYTDVRKKDLENLIAYQWSAE